VNKFVSGGVGTGAYYTDKLTFFQWFSQVRCILHKCVYYIQIFTVGKCLSKTLHIRSHGAPSKK